MKEFFQPWNPTQPKSEIVRKANSIIDDYQRQGYTLTLRQLYYQFVAKDLIDNTERDYKNLGNTITRARLAGLISWEAIEDRNREHNSFYFSENPQEEIDMIPYHIRFNQWKRQTTYIEVWVEKEALGSVVEKACQPYQVPHLSCKGYLSASEAWRAAKRFEKAFDNDKQCVVIHLGDHDPSGLDMSRDNDNRLELLSYGADIDFIRVALNRDQIDHYNPPPNPTKISDSRAKEYIKKHGSESWELDALEPRVIKDLITHHITDYIDENIWEETQKEQDNMRDKLRMLSNYWSENYSDS